MKNNRIWLSWEEQRRTIELAREFSAELIIHEPTSKNASRYISLILRTIVTLIKKRPATLFVQNPSIILSFTTCLLKPFFSYSLIIDRHTNFKLDYRKSFNPKWILFHCLSKFTNKNADAVIVTNRYLAILIKSQCKNVLILPDKIPTLPLPKIDKTSSDRLSALFICTFAHDEPYREVLTAASRIPEVNFYVTGRFKKALSENEIRKLPENIHLLGFIPNSEYFEKLVNSDFTIILTNQEFTLNCGSYESIAAEKPMLISSSRTIKSYFKKGAQYTKSNEAQEIYKSILKLVEELPQKNQEIKNSKVELDLNWQENKKIIESFLITNQGQQ